VVLSFLFGAAMRSFTRRPLAVLVPRTLFLFYAIPVTVAVIVGTFHFNEISPSYLLAVHPDGYKLSNYWVSDYFKHMLLVASACVVASTVFDGRNGKRWITMLLLASLVFVVAQVALIAATGASVAQLQSSRTFLI